MIVLAKNGSVYVEIADEFSNEAVELAAQLLSKLGLQVVLHTDWVGADGQPVEDQGRVLQVRRLPSVPEPIAA